MKFDFDAELTGADGAVLPVYCEVQPPNVGGQKSLIHVAVPAQHITETRLAIRARCWGKVVRSRSVCRKFIGDAFPLIRKAPSDWKTIELFHVERLTIRHPPVNARREIRFHLAPFPTCDRNQVVFPSATDPTQRIFLCWISRTLAQRGSLRSGRRFTTETQRFQARR